MATMNAFNAFASENKTNAQEVKSNSEQPKAEMSHFEKCTKTYLDNYAKTDTAFAVKYFAGNKTIKGCCKYIEQEAKKNYMFGGGSAVMDDATGYGLAVHYFDEDSIEEPKNTNLESQVKVSASNAKNESSKNTKAESTKVAHEGSKNTKTKTKTKTKTTPNSSLLTPNSPKTPNYNSLDEYDMFADL